jgi:hypothetical protein
MLSCTQSVIKCPCLLIVLEFISLRQGSNKVLKLFDTASFYWFILHLFSIAIYLLEKKVLMSEHFADYFPVLIFNIYFCLCIYSILTIWSKT